MSTEYLEQMAREILQRSVRTESRLVTLADHLGFELRNAPKVHVNWEKSGGAYVYVYIAALDVSLSRIVTAVQVTQEWRDLHKGRYTLVVILQEGNGEEQVISNIFVDH